MVSVTINTSLLEILAMKEGLIQKIKTTIFLCICLASSIGFADVSEERVALNELLPQFQMLWNQPNHSKIFDLFHRKSQTFVEYQSNDIAKKKIIDSLENLKADFGEIKNFEIRKHIYRKESFVVRITYVNKGMVPGTFNVRPDSDGQWRIYDIDIDGQGDVELQE